MNKTLFTAAVLALALTACAGRVGSDGYLPVLVTTPNPKLPNIFISDDGVVVVDQEPIRAGKLGEFITVVWALPTPSPYFFDAKGIEFVDPKPEIKTCTNTEKTFNCTFKLINYEHKYMISPSQRFGGEIRRLKGLDPHVVGN